MQETSERRQQPRHAVNAIVRLFLDTEQTTMKAQIMDLSGGGMRLQAPGLVLLPDARLQIRIACADGHAAAAAARVVRTHLDGIAFRFDDVCEGDRELLATPGFWAGAEAIDITPARLVPPPRQ